MSLTHYPLFPDIRVSQVVARARSLPPSCECCDGADELRLCAECTEVTCSACLDGDLVCTTCRKCECGVLDAEHNCADCKDRLCDSCAEQCRFCDDHLCECCDLHCEECLTTMCRFCQRTETPREGGLRFICPDCYAAERGCEC